jgi:hypothetical protein
MRHVSRTHAVCRAAALFVGVVTGCAVPPRPEPPADEAGASPQFERSGASPASRDTWRPGRIPEMSIALPAFCARAVELDGAGAAHREVDSPAAHPPRKPRARELTPRAVYCRDEVRVPISWLLQGLGEKAGRTVAFEIDGYGRRVVDTEPLDAPDARLVAFPFKPAHLMPGEYEMKIYVADGNGGAWLVRRPFEIAPARVPWENLQVLSWNHFDRRSPAHGITIAAAESTAHVARNSRVGMYSQSRLRISLRNARAPAPGAAADPPGAGLRRASLATPSDAVRRLPVLRDFGTLYVLLDRTCGAGSADTVARCEELFCIARRLPHAVPSTMPPSVLEPGVAAPFGGHATADVLREACWLVCARPARVMAFGRFGKMLDKGTGQHTPDEIEKVLGGTPGWDSTVKAIENGKLTLHAWTGELAEEVRRFTREVVRPFGALFPRWGNAPRRIALVTDLIPEPTNDTRATRRGWLNAQVLASGVPFDVLCGRDFGSGAPPSLPYDVVFVSDARALRRSTVDALRAHVASGRTVVVDGARAGNLVFATKLTRADAETDRAPEGTQWSAAALDPRIAGILAAHASLPVRSDSPHVFLNVLAAAGARYVVAVNALRRPGRVYGRYGSFREAGVARRVALRVDRSLGAYAYDLTSRARVELTGTDEAGTRRIALFLGPCDGAILMFSDAGVGTLEIADAPASAPRGGAIDVVLELSAAGGEGAPAEGLVPVELRLERPDGSRSDLSRYDVIEEGRQRWAIPIATNAPTGTWRLRATELATGGVAEHSLEVE